MSQIQEWSNYSSYRNVYFNFVKVDGDEVAMFWRDLAVSQNDRSILMTAEFKQKMIGGTTAFEKALQYQDKAEIYIAYISSKSSSTYVSQIEMAMSVTIGKLEPNGSVFSNMGIFRNLHYKGTNHAKISMELHGYSAKMVYKLHPEAKFMINLPMDNMLLIMEKTLEKEGKACSVYKNLTTSPKNTINIEILKNSVIKLESNGTSYIMESETNEWFYSNECLSSQISKGFPMVVVAIEDLIGCANVDVD